MHVKDFVLSDIIRYLPNLHRDFSLKGLGLPVARQRNDIFEPSRTITSLELSESSILGGTEKDQDNIACEMMLISMFKHNLEKLCILQLKRDTGVLQENVSSCCSCKLRVVLELKVSISNDCNVNINTNTQRASRFFKAQFSEQLGAMLLRGLLSTARAETMNSLKVRPATDTNTLKRQILDLESPSE
uniref:Uncharacterized protein n=1 Tax=Glossina pallidipes TaxID=7398 RepID=A0A1B0A4Z2_GLOPL